MQVVNTIKKTLINPLYKKLLSYIGGQEYLTIQLDITNSCNLACKHCYHPNHNNKGSIHLTDWHSIIDQYEKLYKKLHLKPLVYICGGEPLSSKKLFPIMKYINAKSPTVEFMILTNGTMITEELLQQFTPFNVCFQVSIDGPNQKIHDLIRGIGSFSKAIAGIKKFSEKGFQVYIQTVLSTRTKHLIHDFFSLVEGLPVEALNFTRFIPIGSKNNVDEALAPMELKEAYSQILKLSRSFDIRTGTDRPLFNLIDPKLGNNGKFGFQGMVVDYKGNLKVSSRTNYTIGNILTEGLENLFFNSEIMNKLRCGEIDTCGTCLYYKRCGGDRNAAFAHAGSFLASDPGCWLINQ